MSGWFFRLPISLIFDQSMRFTTAICSAKNDSLDDTMIWFNCRTFSRRPTDLLLPSIIERNRYKHRRLYHFSIPASPFHEANAKRIFEILEFPRFLLVSSFWHFELIANTCIHTSTDGRTADAKNPKKIRTNATNDEQIKPKYFDSTFSWIPIVN